MMIKLISKSWNNVKHEKVETYENITVVIRSFSAHFDKSFECDGWSLGLGWLQISYGTFSKPLSIGE